MQCESGGRLKPESSAGAPGESLRVEGSSGKPRGKETDIMTER